MYFLQNLQHIYKPIHIEYTCTYPVTCMTSERNFERILINCLDFLCLQIQFQEQSTSFVVPIHLAICVFNTAQITSLMSIKLI